MLVVFWLTVFVKLLMVVLVAFNCLPVTASVELSLNAASFKPVNFTLFTEIFASVVVPPVVFLGLNVILAASASAPPEEIVNPSLPVIDFIFVNASAKPICNPLPSASFVVLILLAAVLVPVGTVPSPLIESSSPNVFATP